MYPLTCGFCKHGNPADARFCNGCGAPLSATPCSKCGAVNDAAAMKCHECGEDLAGAPTDDLFLPLPPETATGPGPTLRYAEIPAQGDILHAAPRDSAITLHNAPAPYGRAPDFERAAGARHARSVTPAAVAFVALLGLSAYGGYRYFSATGTAARSNVGIEAKGLATGGEIDQAQSTRASGTPALAKSAAAGEVPRDVAAPRESPVPPEEKAIRGDAARPRTTPPRDGGSGALARAQSSAEPSRAAESEVRTTPRLTLDAPSRPPATEGVNVSARTSAGAAAAAPVPGLGPCTDAVAALGLCPRDNVQKKEP